jgi:hypothetical protein
MSISYGELVVIGEMTDSELGAEYNELCTMPQDEDTEDTINAILQEMESRGLEHP